MNKPAAAAVAQAMNAETIRNQQQRIRELESALAIAKNNVKRANDETQHEHERAEMLATRSGHAVAALKKIESRMNEYRDHHMYAAAADLGAIAVNALHLVGAKKSEVRS